MSILNSSNNYAVRVGALVLVLFVMLSFLATVSASYEVGVLTDEQLGGVRMIEIGVNSDADLDYKRHDWSLNVGCPIVSVKHMGDLDAKHGRISNRGWAESRTQLGQTDFRVHVETEGWDLFKGGGGYVHSKFLVICLA